MLGTTHRNTFSSNSIRELSPNATGALTLRRKNLVGVVALFVNALFSICINIEAFITLNAFSLVVQVLKVIAFDLLARCFGRRIWEQECGFTAHDLWAELAFAIEGHPFERFASLEFALLILFIRISIF